MVRSSVSMIISNLTVAIDIRFKLLYDSLDARFKYGNQGFQSSCGSTDTTMNNVHVARGYWYAPTRQAFKDCA